MQEISSFVVTVEIVEGVSSSPHYAIELLEIKHPVSISVSLFQHLLQLIIRNLLSHLYCDAFQVFKSDFVEIVFIEKFEYLEYLVLGVSGALDISDYTNREAIIDWNSLKLSPSLISFPISL